MAEPAPIRPHVTDPEAWDALMARAQAGDVAAYRRLLDAITPWLRAIARRAHYDRSDAEDTVQDILLTLHEVRHTYDPTRPFRPWLAGIARHRVMDRLRRRGRIAAREVALDLTHEAFAASEPSHEENSARRAMRAGIAALPSGQRQALTLVKVEEMSLREASTASGISVAALKVATHRGVKALRRMLGEER